MLLRAAGRPSVRAHAAHHEGKKAVSARSYIQAAGSGAHAPERVHLPHRALHCHVDQPQQAHHFQAQLAVAILLHQVKVPQAVLLHLPPSVGEQVHVVSWAECSQTDRLNQVGGAELQVACCLSCMKPGCKCTAAAPRTL